MLGGRSFNQLSRREMLLYGAAGVVTAGAGGSLWLLTASRPHLVFALLQRALPGVDLDRASVMECCRDVVAAIDGSFQGAWAQRLVSNLKLKGVRRAGNVLGSERVAAAGPVEERLDEITRLAITRLLPNSNFFRIADPQAETIYYVRPGMNAACGNPFADLSLPA